MERPNTPNNHLNTRILALDLHPRSFGYVIVEKPERLLDWGVKRSYRKAANHPHLLLARLRSLLKLWAPNTVVTLVGERRSKDIQQLFRRIRKEVSPKSFVAVRGSTSRGGGRGKYERAIAIATRFPEITRKLPAKRKPWESEDYSMSIFDALHIAAIYISLSHSNIA